MSHKSGKRLRARERSRRKRPRDVATSAARCVRCGSDRIAVMGFWAPIDSLRREYDLSPIVGCTLCESCLADSDSTSVEDAILDRTARRAELN